MFLNVQDIIDKLDEYTACNLCKHALDCPRWWSGQVAEPPCVGTDYIELVDEEKINHAIELMERRYLKMEYDEYVEEHEELMDAAREQLEYETCSKKEDDVFLNFGIKKEWVRTMM